MKRYGLLSEIGLDVRHRRRIGVLALTALGAVLLWVPVNEALGVGLLLAALGLELIGLAVEQRRRLRQ